MKLHAELIFIWKVSHLDSFWYRGTRQTVCRVDLIPDFMGEFDFIYELNIAKDYYEHIRIIFILNVLKL